MTSGTILTQLHQVRAQRLIVLLETPRTGAGLDVAAAALRRGCTPIVLMQDPDNIDRFVIDSYLRMGALVACCDTGSSAAVVRSCRALSEQNEVVAITCAYEYYTERGAEAARALGLPGPDPTAIRTCRSKRLLRAALSAREGLNPRHAVVNSVQRAAAAVRDIGLPVVLKPANLTGSVYVKRCDDEAAVRDMAGKIISMGSYLGVPVEPVAVVEEFLDGPEFSVEMLDGRAIGVTAKETSAPPFFVELGHTYPAPSPADAIRRVCSAAESALAVVGLDTGPAHVEVKLDPSACRALVIDVNPRLGGGRIPELVRLAQGISLSAAQIDALLGLPVDLRPTRHRVAAIRFVPTPAKGRLVCLDGIDAAAAIDGVAEVAMEPEVGGDYFANGSNRDRVVHVIAVADYADEAQDIARSAIEQLTIEWADLAGDPGYP